MSSGEESVSEKEISDIDNDVEEVKAQEDNEQESEEVKKDEEGEEEKKVVKPKRVVRNPQPKLNEETLKGPRGLGAIETYFERVKFKGKGYEDKDLNIIMKTYEYWCHRLFPKFPFDTCIERLEKLGTKKATQTHIKRIRYNLIVEDKPIIDDSDEEQNAVSVNAQQEQPVDQQVNDQFDKLLGSTAKAPSQISEEQLERMRINKERAAKLRLERLQKIKDKASKNLILSSQLPCTSSEHIESEGSSTLPEIETNIEEENHLNASQVSTNSLQNEDMELESVENMLLEDENSFNHESNVKGKSNISGRSIKKKSTKQPDDDASLISTNLSEITMSEHLLNENLWSPKNSDNQSEGNKDCKSQGKNGSINHSEKRLLKEAKDNDLEDDKDLNENVPRKVKKRAAVLDSDDDL